MILAVDIGNTSVSLGLFRDEQLLATFHFDSVPGSFAESFGEALAEALLRIPTWTHKVEGAIVASVKPKMNPEALAAIEQATGVAPLLMSHDLDLGIEYHYEPRTAVGLDRLANVIAAVKRRGAPVIVVDIGTATTLDAVSEDRLYLGGAILPGPGTCAAALSLATAQLPEVKLHAPEKVLGLSTHDCILSGLIHGHASAVDGMIERARHEMGTPDCPVIITGGYSHLIAPCTSHARNVDPDLTLFGLLLVFLRNR